MPFYIKKETFTEQTLKMLPTEREVYIAKHLDWIKELQSFGVRVSSGYLVNASRRPGGGGLLILETSSYNEAKKLIKKDPMIIACLVNWTLYEWIPIGGNLIN